MNVQLTYACKANSIYMDEEEKKRDCKLASKTSHIAAETQDYVAAMKLPRDRNRIKVKLGAEWLQMVGESRGPRQGEGAEEHERHLEAGRLYSGRVVVDWRKGGRREKGKWCKEAKGAKL